MAAQDNILKMEEKVVLGLQHDPTIWISEGASRFSTSWKNKKIRWAELLARLKNATMTQETQAEYMKMSKPQQDQIKDNIQDRTDRQKAQRPFGIADAFHGRSQRIIYKGKRDADKGDPLVDRCNPEDIFRNSKQPQDHRCEQNARYRDQQTQQDPCFQYS